MVAPFQYGEYDEQEGRGESGKFGGVRRGGWRFFGEWGCMMMWVFQFYQPFLNTSKEKMHKQRGNKVSCEQSWDAIHFSLIFHVLKEV